MRRYALAVVVLALLLPAIGDAQSRDPGPSWTCSLDAVADAPTLCIQAPEPGMRRYITDVIVQSTTTAAGFVNLLYAPSAASGGTPDCGATAFTLFPAGLDNNSERFMAAANTAQPTAYADPQALIVPAGMDLCVIGDADVNSVTVQLIGYTAP